MNKNVCKFHLILTISRYILMINYFIFAFKILSLVKFACDPRSFFIAYVTRQIQICITYFQDVYSNNFSWYLK